MAVVGEDLTYGFWPIDLTKSHDTDDGLMVYGKAAGPGLDLDGQRFNAEYLNQAVPAWFEWGNVREQHQQIAAGVGVELEDKGNGEYWVKALVVDPVTIKKVKTKVLKGFSPGVRNGKIRKSANAPNGEIYQGDMIELSLVDRPSDPTNGVMICKSAGGALFLPTDAAGNELAFENESVPVMWLTEDLHKSASATALDVLNGDLEDADQDETTAALHTLADLVIAESFMLKSADLAAGQYDVSNLRNGLEALLALAEPEDYEGMNSDFADLAKSATINGNTEDLVKAATAEITKAFNAKVEALMQEVTQLKATPVGGGAPLVLPPQHVTAQINKSAGTGIDYSALATSATDPVLKAEYTKLAARQGAKTS